MKILALGVLALLAISCFAAEHPTTTTMLRKLGKSASFNQQQIDNARDILQACVGYTTDQRKLAYVLSTAIEQVHGLGSLLGVDLVGNPDLALRPDIAGRVICLGMAKGLFTGIGLDNYFTASGSDWTNARRIVNGLDKAQEFGNRALNIFNQP